MRTWLRPAIWTAAGVLAVLAATAITLGVSASGSSGGANGTGTVANGNARVCERLAVPAYFSPPYWETAIHSRYPPTDMILNVSGLGAGAAPVPGLQALARQARAAGITVLGYSSTASRGRRRRSPTTPSSPATFTGPTGAPGTG